MTTSNELRALLERVEGGGGDKTPVFVFGSNLAGRHGKGAALWAKKMRGAIQGRGIGRQGNSYAIPTKDTRLLTLPLSTISVHVENFLQYASERSFDSFQLTPIGCGLAGYTPEQIAPMFRFAPSNVLLPEEFIQVLRAKLAQEDRP